MYGRISFVGSVSAFVAFALIIGVLWWPLPVQGATWTSNTVGNDQYWYLDGNQKFRFNLTNQQWWHYATFGAGWYQLSATGASSAFLGDGFFHNLANGFNYAYNTAADLGWFRKDGAAGRFGYYYTPGRWITTGNYGGWQYLGNAGLSASFLGEGTSWHDLGNGFSYLYTAATDLGWFRKTTGGGRFGYYYVPGKWITTGNSGGWQYIGDGALSASFLGDAAWHDLGNGFTYSYNSAADLGWFKKWGTTGRFGYYYGPARWVTMGNFGTWQLIGNAGLSASFLGDTAWHDLGNGFIYGYNSASDIGWFKKGTAGRFGYFYDTGQWVTTANSGGWQTIGNAGLSAGFLGDAAPHDLGNGFTFVYSGGADLGIFRKGGVTNRFAYYYATGQWQNQGNVGGWQNIGNAGLSASFLGDGAVHDFVNGVAYRYLGDFGYRRIAGKDRFRYDYTIGQWWQYDLIGASFALSATGVSAKSIGDYTSADPLSTGTGFAFWYDGTYGYWMVGGEGRFRYMYESGQWQHGRQGSYANIGNLSYLAGFIGDGSYRDLANGWSFKYDGGAGAGIWRDLGTNLDKFSYAYSNGLWNDLDKFGNPFALGSAGASPSFVGDGLVHALDGTWSYRYDGIKGYWLTGGAQRFAYEYGTGNWRHYDRNDTSWLLAGNRTGQFIGSNAVGGVDLGNGFSFRYDTGTAFWLLAGAPRFHYVYDAGQWFDYGSDAVAQALSFPGASGKFIAEYSAGLPLAALYGAGYWYDGPTDTGYWAINGVSRLKYSYASGQWSDHYIPRGWMGLGNATLSAAFIGDGTYHGLAQGFTYMTDGTYGYFKYDPAHHFRQSYGNGSWSYEGSGGVWSPWAAATLVKDINPGSLSSGSGAFWLAGGYIGFIGSQGGPVDFYIFDGRTLSAPTNYFTSLDYIAGANPPFVYSGTEIFFKGSGGSAGAGVYELYRWDGATFTEVSNNSDFTSLAFLGRSGNDFFFSASGGAAGAGTEIYVRNGSTFSQISNTSAFTAVQFLASSNGGFFFTGTGGVAGSGVSELYRWNSTTLAFEELSSNSDFTALGLLGSLGSDLFFTASGGAAGSGNEAYRLNGSTFAQVTNSSGFTGIQSVSTSGNDIFFIGGGGVAGSGLLELYHWNGTTLAFDEVSNNGDFTFLVRAASSGNDIFFLAVGGAAGSGVFELYRWNAGTASFGEVSNNGDFTSLGQVVSSGNDISFLGSGGTAGSGVYELYRWNSATSSFEEISNNADFTSLSFLNFSAYTGGDLFFGGTGGVAGTGTELFRWDGATFTQLTALSGFTGLQYNGSAGTDRFFTAYTALGRDIYRWTGSAFLQISNNSLFGAANVYRRGTNDVFVIATGGAAGPGWQLYHWDGSTFAQLTNSGFAALNVLILGNTGTDSVFSVSSGGSQYIYRWDGATFSQATSTIYQSFFPSLAAAYSGDTYFYAMTAAQGMEPWRYWGLWGTLSARGF